jgi:hypothetical protein
MKKLITTVALTVLAGAVQADVFDADGKYGSLLRDPGRQYMHSIRPTAVQPGMGMGERDEMMGSYSYGWHPREPQGFWATNPDLYQSPIGDVERRY